MRRFLIALATFAGCGCSQRQAQSPPPPPDVTVARPLEREVIEWDEYTGHLEAVEFVEVRARVSGLIMNTPFQEGSIVRKSDLLVEIDVRPFQAELDARLAEEKRAGAQVDLAQVEYKRLRDLVPKEAAAPFEFQTAEANLRQAQAALAASQAAVESARLNVEWCRVV